MKVEIITIGDELLIGQTINTNASWLGQELSLLGANISRVVTISDKSENIIRALEEIDADLCIITGGLGPTNDDITKHVLAQYFDSKLVLHSDTLSHIETFFKKRNRPMLQVNIEQALLPSDCEILQNRLGTAAGMWFDKNGKSVISLPGVPYEMKTIFSEEIVPKLIERFTLNSLYHKTIITHGIGESFLADKIIEWERKLSKQGLTLAYLPSPGIVKLRISSPIGKKDFETIEEFIKELEHLIPENIIGFENDTMSGVTGALLKKHGLSVGSVESCTAGAIASTFVENPGSSSYFHGSLLTYQTSMKVSLLGIPADFITEHDVVSEDVAKAMAHKAKEILGCSICVSTTGIMGPDAGDSKQSVGTVWIGLATSNGVTSKKFIFGENRSRNIKMTTLAAINMVRQFILTEYCEKIPK